MFKVNLLPPQEKKKLELAELSHILAFSAVRLVFILIIFILVLISAYFCLRILINTQNDLIEVRQRDEKAQLQTEVEEKIQRLNQDAKKIYLKQNNLIVWVPILEELSEITPSGIYLINFSYRTSTGQIDLNGWADNRDKLLVFENLLKESSYFEEIKSPLTNLIKQTNINFSFTLKLPSFEEGENATE